MHVGLFFGSFNPIHVGHLIIANHMINFAPIDQLWMVVSPHNPHKKKKSLANDYDRLHLVHLGIGENTRISASNIEFSLPRPSYTIDTLTYLAEKYPHYKFSLIMGGDNLASLHKWKNYELILKHHEIFVYSRPNIQIGKLESHPGVHLLEAPMLDISSTMIRDLIKNGKSIQYLVPSAVFEYIDANNLYK